MTLNEIENRIIGSWTGGNTLHLSWLEPSEYVSASDLTAAKAVGGKFLAINYTWEHENQPHEGFLLIGFDQKQEIASASWADSWHQSSKPMALAGKIIEPGIIELVGSFEVPNSPDWIWRIAIITGDDRLTVEMYNVSPEGAEDLAVRAEYTRTE